MPATSKPACACAVSLIELSEALGHVDINGVRNRAAKHGMTEVQTWRGAPGLSPADAAVIYGDFRAEADASSATAAAYSVYLRERQQAAEAERAAKYAAEKEKAKARGIKAALADAATNAADKLRRREEEVISDHELHGSPVPWDAFSGGAR